MKIVYTVTNVYYKSNSSAIPSTSAVIAESEEKLVELLKDIAKEITPEMLGDLFKRGRVMYKHEDIDIVREFSVNFLHS